jgi:hypothetical protein
MGSGDAAAVSKQGLYVPHYADEVLCANWNPLARLLAEQLAPAPVAAIDGGDVEALLTRLYRCQQA